MYTVDWDYTRQVFMRWAPKVAIAIIILVVAHFVAKAVKWAVAQGVDRIPFLTKPSRTPPPGRATTAEPAVDLGDRIGEVAYWVVWLLGLIAALNQLGLVSIVAHLNNMVDGFLRYVPQVVGALLIFLVGFALATIVRRMVEAAVQAAELDRRLMAAGLSLTPQGPGLSRLLGILVFTLIIIPVSIQALATLNITAISDPATSMLSDILATIPRVLGATLTIFIAYLVGRWIGVLAEQGLKSIGFDDIVGGLMRAEPIRASMERMDPTPGVDTVDMTKFPPSRLIGMTVLIGIVLFASIEATRLLGFGQMSAMLTEVLDLASRILFGVVIITIGVLLGNILSIAVARGDRPSAAIMSVFAQWGVIGLATAVGLRFMGLANEIITIAFALVLGAVAVAIAFGIGGRDAAKRALDNWTAAPPRVEPQRLPPAE
jgi:hypothetical protein